MINYLILWFLGNKVLEKTTQISLLTSAYTVYPANSKYITYCKIACAYKLIGKSKKTPQLSWTLDLILISAEWSQQLSRHRDNVVSRLVKNVIYSIAASHKEWN